MEKELQTFFLKENYRLRPAISDDIDRLVDIINEAYSYQDEAKGEPRTNPSHLKKRISETDFFVIEHRTDLIGCVYLEPRKDVLHFGLLTLSPEYRGRGVAGQIIEAIEAYAINDYTSLELDYMSLAPWLKKYYEKFGFTETGEVQSWGTIELVHMKKLLS
jgi:N-acetylglutamate synthase-like GNAT family acetyltransferase